MKFTKTAIKDVFIIEPEIKEDIRGYFTRIFCKDELSEQKIKFDIAQINRSFTQKKGTIRGFHFQKEPKAEDRIIQCLKGTIYDVAIDLRPKSKTFGKWIAQELSGDNKKLFLIPKGFAHGFQTLTKNCEVLYFMSEFYVPEYAYGLRWDDPYFAIPWPIKNPTVAERDRKWALFKT